MIDLHIHTAYSDGTDSLSAVLQNVQNAGITHFSITDHDTVEGSALMRPLAQQAGISYTVGIEFSCQQFGKLFHILGYRLDETNAVFAKTVRDGILFRRENCLLRLQQLKDLFSIGLPKADEDELLSNPTVGKPHIAQKLVDYGYADSIHSAIRKYLNAPGKKLKLSVQEAIDSIHAAGGIAVWAHPFGENKERFLPYSEVTDLFYRIKELGIDGLECFYSQYTPDMQEFLESLALSEGLLVSGGSDYHGKNKPTPIGKICDSPDASISDSRFTILQKF